MNLRKIVAVFTAFGAISFAANSGYAQEAATDCFEDTTLGANATLQSYGVDLEHLSGYRSTEQVDEVIFSVIPDRHVDFLRSLPILMDAGRFLFVHAGIRPGIPLERQTDDDLVFIRGDFYNAAHLLKQWVVHGHTPIDRPQPEGRRINIDTGAFYTGRLTALRLWQNKGRVLST